MSISQRHFASRNHLPIEILAEIADHMASDYILDSSDRYKNLGSCCLVSRTFRQAFRPQQFRRISIHDPLPSDSPRYKPSMRAFAALLQQDPLISTYVRKLCITMDFGPVPTSQKVEYAPSAEALLHGPTVLSSLTHVEEFTWETSFPGLEVPFQAIIEPMKQSLLHVLRLPTLRKLECFNIDGISIEDIPRNITSLALRDAALSRSPSPEGSPVGSPDSRSNSPSSSTGASEAPVTQIQTLRLANIDSYWAKQLSDAMDYHPLAFGAVRDLNLVNVEVGVVRRALLCAGESLKKLHMSFLPLSEHDLGRYFGYLDLSSNPCLESLTLSFGCWLSPSTLDRLLSSLSKSLRSLAHSNVSTIRVEIQAQHREGVIPLLLPTRWKGVNAALAAEEEDDPDRFPYLRQVTLCVSNYEYPTFSFAKKNYEGVDQAVEEARQRLLPVLENAQFVLETNFVDPLLW